MKSGRALARNRFQSIAARCLPVLKRVGGYVFSEMEYVAQGWYAIAGWEEPGIVEAQEKHWPQLVENVAGPGPLGVSHLPWEISRELRPAHNVMMSYGYVLARAGRNKQRLSILDWGGGLGHYNLYSKALLPELAIEYECYDLPPLCRAGRKVQPDIVFHDDERKLPGNRYDLVISSSSLHYVEDWRAQLLRLGGLTREFLYLARLQSLMLTPTFLALHRVYRDGYGEFLSWCINRDELVDCAQRSGLILLREFVYGEPWTVRGAPERPATRGYLFRRSDT